MQKLSMFLYINNEQSEKEIKKTILFTIIKSKFKPRDKRPVHWKLQSIST